MKQKPRLISLLLALAFFLFSNLGIGVLPATAIARDGSSMRPPVIPTGWHKGYYLQSNTSEQKNYSSQSDTSELTQPDEFTEKTYEEIGFDPETSTDLLNMTSARVLKPVFNKYEENDPSKTKPKVFGYYTDWSQYDDRLSDCAYTRPGEQCEGRGYDMAKVDP